MESSSSEDMLHEKTTAEQTLSPPLEEEVFSLKGDLELAKQQISIDEKTVEQLSRSLEQTRSELYKNRRNYNDLKGNLQHAKHRPRCWRRKSNSSVLNKSWQNLRTYSFILYYHHMAISEFCYAFLILGNVARTVFGGSKRVQPKALTQEADEENYSA